MPLQLLSPHSRRESPVGLDLQRELPDVINSGAVTESVRDVDIESISGSSPTSLSNTSTESPPWQIRSDPVRLAAHRRARRSTIYPDDQGADRDPPLEVELQRSYTGCYIIPSSLADQQCSTFGVQGLLNELNGIMGTSLPLSTSLEFHLSRCISLNYDFGLAYSYLRPHWYYDFDTLAARMDQAESDDAVVRRDALDPSKKYITDPYLSPRRVWDLYSNRVIPYYWWRGYLGFCLPVSHSWAAENERSAVWTSINANAWPVPAPNGLSLERVRIELLNYAASEGWPSWRNRPEYSWLDVLCLRQVGREEDHSLRIEEWMTDVPTIGSIYQFDRALVYFNGLGQPFRNSDYEDPRHWFNRAWTVQEAVSFPFLGGATPSSPSLNQQQLQPSPDLEEFSLRFASAFGRYGILQFSGYVTLMRERHATNDIDRISGLASISGPESLPIYDANQSNEDAWEMLVKVIHGYYRAHLFFWYPVAGNIRHLWFPSWAQAMAEDVFASAGDLESDSKIQYDETQKNFHGNFIVLDDCLVYGLDFPSHGISPGTSAARTGSITWESRGIEGTRQHSVVAHHQVVIDEACHYTLLSPASGTLFNPRGKRLVIGLRNDAGHFQKLCVLDFVVSESYNEVKRTGSREDVVLL